jgi:hypothetical protein
MAEQTVDELTAELAALRTARTELLTNGGVKEVWRDGRKVVYNTASVKDLNDAIKDTEARLAAAEAAAAASCSRPRFRALKVGF